MNVSKHTGLSSLLLIAILCANISCDNKSTSPTVEIWLGHSPEDSEKLFQELQNLDRAGDGIIFIMRKGGRLVVKGGEWAEGRHFDQQDFLAALTTNESQGSTFDAIEINHVLRRREVAASEFASAFRNVDRGILGLGLVVGNRSFSFTPTEMIAQNLTFSTALKRVLTLAKIQDASQGTLFALDIDQYLVSGDDSLLDSPMNRGNDLVLLEHVDRDAIEELAAGMGNWLAQQVQEDGRMVYKYWPSNGRESAANNMIRQFMASVCLGRWIEFTKGGTSRELLRRNMDYNLENFYRPLGRMAYVEFNGKVKLGAVALAALSLVENDFDGAHDEYVDAMIRFVDWMWTPTGEFNTWYRGKPEGSSNAENFYPGEALLLWATIIEGETNTKRLDKFLTSFRFYRDWHRKNRNPAFVPWHTQAYYKIWQSTGNQEISDFIFEMNDWLVGYQQWNSAPFPDVKGRFYDPRRTHYGPPHASSTGVYLEGLIDAFSLAREIGDEKRMAMYRRTIVRGLRSVMQLQFRDEVDMFYISQRDRVRGAIRTTVYNNEIRVDNVQHNLMAVMKILAQFDGNDFELGQEY